MRDRVPGSRGHQVSGRAVALVACAAAMVFTLGTIPARAQAEALDPYAATVLAAGPTSYWRLGDAGSVAIDELAQNPGAVTGGVATGEPGAIPGSASTAMRFDGVSGYVGLGSNPSLRPDLFTIEAWFRSFGQTTTAGYLGRWRTFGWEAAVDTRGRAFGSIYGTSGKQYITRSVKAFDDGLWHHYALTRDATSLILSVDGEVVSSVAMTEPSRYGAGGAAIGRQGNFDCCYFNGVIDEFALYDHALTALELQDHYCAGGGAASFCNDPPTADAGADQLVIEGSTVTLDGSGSSDPDGDTLAHSWQLMDAIGPAVALSSTTDAQPTFVAPDDATYRFELTVSDGQETSTDDAVITVVNAPPGADLVVVATPELRTVKATTAITDRGPLDTHTAVFDWGDGSQLEAAPSAAPGGGSVEAVHTFEHPGVFTVTTLVADDDGGQVTRSADIAVADYEPLARASLWANAVGDGAGLQLVGSDVEVAGLVHSNSDLSIVGDGVHLLGGTEYAGSLVVKGQHHVLDDPLVRVNPDALPLGGAIERYRPGTNAARSAASAYHDTTASCRNGVWQPTQPLATGIYYVPCAVRLSGRALDSAPITIAAEGEIALQVTGAESFEPFADDVLLVSGSASRRAIQVSGAGARVAGWFVAPHGTIVVQGARIEFVCGLVADRIAITGAQLRFQRSSCQ